MPRPKQPQQPAQPEYDQRDDYYLRKRKKLLDLIEHASPCFNLGHWNTFKAEFKDRSDWVDHQYITVSISEQLSHVVNDIYEDGDSWTDDGEEEESVDCGWNSPVLEQLAACCYLESVWMAMMTDARLHIYRYPHYTTHPYVLATAYDNPVALVVFGNWHGRTDPEITVKEMQDMLDQALNKVARLGHMKGMVSVQADLCAWKLDVDQRAPQLTPLSERGRIQRQGAMDIIRMLG